MWTSASISLPALLMDDFSKFDSNEFVKLWEFDDFAGYFGKTQPGGRNVSSSAAKANGRPTSPPRRLPQWRCVRTVAVEQCLLSSFLCAAKEGKKKTSKTVSPRSIGRDEGTCYHKSDFARCWCVFMHTVLRQTNGWNLKITHLKRKIIFQTSIFGFHISFRACTPKIVKKSCLRWWKWHNKAPSMCGVFNGSILSWMKSTTFCSRFVSLTTKLKKNFCPKTCIYTDIHQTFKVVVEDICSCWHVLQEIKWIYHILSPSPFLH